MCCIFLFCRVLHVSFIFTSRRVAPFVLLVNTKNSLPRSRSRMTAKPAGIWFRGESGIRTVRQLLTEIYGSNIVHDPGDIIYWVYVSGSITRFPQIIVKPFFNEDIDFNFFLDFSAISSEYSSFVSRLMQRIRSTSKLLISPFNDLITAWERFSSQKPWRRQCMGPRYVILCLCSRPLVTMYAGRICSNKQSKCHASGKARTHHLSSPIEGKKRGQRGALQWRVTYKTCIEFVDIKGHDDKGELEREREWSVSIYKNAAAPIV